MIALNPHPRMRIAELGIVHRPAAGVEVAQDDATEVAAVGLRACPIAERNDRHALRCLVRLVGIHRFSASANTAHGSNCTLSYMRLLGSAETRAFPAGFPSHNECNLHCIWERHDMRHKIYPLIISLGFY